MQTEWINEAIKAAARAIRDADALLIGAGAGMGVDSGLPDFRGTEGFWRAYPAFQKLDLRFERGPALRIGGSTGAVDDGAAAGAWRVALAAPLPRAEMALLQAMLERWVPAAFWTAFTEGRIDSASADIDGAALRAAGVTLRGAAFAAAPCCADMACCKEGADCCKEGKKDCCADMKKGGDHAGHDMSGTPKK